MNELLEALGLKLEFDDTYIQLIRETVLLEQSTPFNPSNQWGGIITYRGGLSQYPKRETIWYYQTEFGAALEKYNAKMYNPPAITFNPQLHTGMYQQGLSGWGQSSGQLTIGGSLMGGLAGQQQSQLSQQQQLQQAAQQMNIYTSPYCPPGQIYITNPNTNVVIGNTITDNTEEPPKEFTLLSKIKKFFGRE